MNQQMTGEKIMDVSEIEIELMRLIEQRTSDTTISSLIERHLEVYRKEILFTAKFGWFPLPELSPGEEIIHLDRKISQSPGGYKGETTNAALEEMLADFFIPKYEENFAEIQDEIINKNPERADFLKLAFKAHEQKEYKVSIPLFFMQIDGICFDKLKVLLFRGNRKGKKGWNAAKMEVEDGNYGSITKVFLVGLTESNWLPIAMDDSKVETQLNRHLVMHGKDLSYGTEVNSYKALSMLNYISWVLSSFDFNNPTPPLQEG